MRNQFPSAASANGRNGSGNGPSSVQGPPAHEVAFGYPRDFLRNHFVYLVISPRAKGLSIGINLNPVMRCNLNCVYCEVDRSRPAIVSDFDVHRMAMELRETLELVRGGWLRQWPRYAKLPAELLEVRHVALSGDGEPTLSDHFLDATRAVTHLRTMNRFFKIVLVTNSTALDQPQVQEGLAMLSEQDEVWAKLDGGTQDYVSRIDGPTVSLEKTLSNILMVGRQRPVVIQSLFPEIDGDEPPGEEINQYASRLKELKDAGANISLVQVYSATRPMARPGCGHLPLKSLSQIAKTVRRVSGLRAEVF
jgi:wyosine [tRNA(Phe)-imidazoG37] synthetase (radical SAM superfamily)